MTVLSETSSRHWLNFTKNTTQDTQSGLSIVHGDLNDHDKYIAAEYVGYPTKLSP